MLKRPEKRPILEQTKAAKSLLTIRILGSGNAAQVPVWGCHCLACERARRDHSFRRGPCSLEIRTELGTTLIDAGFSDLAERYDFEEITRIVLTHFHMDHVQGLFHLRWSERAQKIPVFRPDDEKGADDLYKHPGVLDFQAPFIPFNTVQLQDFSITPLPLIHSKITLGYVIEKDGFTFAYLTDTVGLPDASLAFLRNKTLDCLIVDCSEPPTPTAPRNHNDINLALWMYNTLEPKQMILTHISHRLDCWLLEHKESLPANIKIASDGLTIYQNTEFSSGKH
ncbi:phosphonate metabolism protein PhnP [Marinomonas spartinae]|uniref:phosphonate metabolism protein PhnP n=1 Tax=Marinomonas spartinae TaxID=1792290 RepID=UPI0018F26181|nr:phosphonate metabolism protein PhnP [Marinomonas spartinae]MBJ7554108.1 phosphonate metabolism protein PhnP [Marinomonas spartinae]